MLSEIRQKKYQTALSSFLNIEPALRDGSNKHNESILELYMYLTRLHKSSRQDILCLTEIYKLESWSLIGEI